MDFFNYYKKELEKSQISEEQKGKILEFIYKNSSFNRHFTTDFLAFLDDYNKADDAWSDEFKAKNIKQNLLCILADLAYIFESGTRAGGVNSFAYCERAENLLNARMAFNELESLRGEYDLITTLGEACLYGENTEMIKAEILATHFANEIMQSEVSGLLSA